MNGVQSIGLVKRAAWWVGAVCAILLIGVPAAAAGTTRQRILSVAEQEIGYRDHGYFCTKYGPCEPWCSLFVTWVWQHSGVAVPSLAFTGYLYDWAQGATYVLGPHAPPEPGDAVLFGTGPATVDTSPHAGIVEAVYPGYLVTIEGDSLHGVRRYVVPLRDPQLVGEPGAIYGYASPAGAAGSRALVGRRAALSTFPAPPRAAIARQDVAPRRSSPRRSSEHARLLHAIAALRAFQHMPYRIADTLIDWTGVTPGGLVEVRVRSAMPMSHARSAWLAFLHRFDDSGHAYAVTFQAPPDPPAATPAPTTVPGTGVTTVSPDISTRT